jgi:hypothetical protein
MGTLETFPGLRSHLLAHWPRLVTARDQLLRSTAVHIPTRPVTFPGPRGRPEPVWPHGHLPVAKPRTTSQSVGQLSDIDRVSPIVIGPTPQSTLALRCTHSGHRPCTTPLIGQLPSCTTPYMVVYDFDGKFFSRQLFDIFPTTHRLRGMFSRSHTALVCIRWLCTLFDQRTTTSYSMHKICIYARNGTLFFFEYF